ncbi:hypothetical protein AHAS_Ahas01G0123900 [Arachis hypogaea]
MDDTLDIILQEQKELQTSHNITLTGFASTLLKLISRIPPPSTNNQSIFQPPSFSASPLQPHDDCREATEERSMKEILESQLENKEMECVLQQVEGMEIVEEEEVEKNLG